MAISISIHPTDSNRTPFMEIMLEQVRFRGHIGVFPQERTVGNDYLVDLMVGIPDTPLTTDGYKEEDELHTTISYADLYAIVKEEMEKERKLLETSARAIARRIKSEWSQVEYGSVKITKTTPPIRGFQGAAGVKLTF